MKNRLLLMIFFVLATTLSLKAQNSFEKIAEMKGVTSVYISPKMFGMMKDTDTGNINLDKVVNKLTGLQILSTEDKDASTALRKETTFINRKNGYEELMRVKDGEERMFIYMKEGNDVNQYVLMVDEGNEFTLIVLEGKLTIDEIRGIVNQ